MKDRVCIITIVGIVLCCIANLSCVGQNSDRHSDTALVKEKIEGLTAELTGHDEKVMSRAETQLRELALAYPVEVAARYDAQTNDAILVPFRRALLQTESWNESKKLLSELRDLRSACFVALETLVELPASEHLVFEALATLAEKGCRVPPEFVTSACKTALDPERDILDRAVAVQFLSNLSDTESLSTLKALALSSCATESGLVATMFAIQALFERHPLDLLDFLQKSYDRLGAGDVFRKFVLERLAEAKMVEALPFVLCVADDKRRSSSERLIAVACAVSLGDMEKIADLAQSVPMADDSELSNIFRALSDAGKIEYADLIRKYGLPRKDASGEAVKGLAKLHAITKEDLFKIYQDSANDESSSLALACLTALKGFIHNMTSHDFATLFDRTQSIDVKVYLASVVASCASSEAPDFLTQIAAHGCEKDAISAAYALAKLHSAEYKQDVLIAIRRGILSADPRVRSVALKALAEVADKWEICAIMELLQQEEASARVKAYAAAIFLCLMADIGAEKADYAK